MDAARTRPPSRLSAKPRVPNRPTATASARLAIASDPIGSMKQRSAETMLKIVAKAPGPVPQNIAETTTAG